MAMTESRARLVSDSHPHSADGLTEKSLAFSRCLIAVKYQENEALCLGQRAICLFRYSDNILRYSWCSLIFWIFCPVISSAFLTICAPFFYAIPYLIH